MANPVTKINLSIYKNSVYTHRFNINDANGVPVNLTGFTALLDMRASSSADPVLYQATSSDDITVNPAGYVVLEIPATTIEAWDFDSAQYDLVLQPAGVAADSVCVARGSVVIYGNITDI
jgi:hypothetical protein